MVLSAISDVPIYSLSKARNIDSSIRISCDIYISVLKFWELRHDAKKSLKIVISRIKVGPDAFFLISTCGKSNSSWAIYVNNIRFFVP